MKVLYISEIYPDVKRGLGVWGGGERQFYEISKRVANRGHEVTILTCRFPGQPAEEIVNGINVYRIGLSRDPKTGGASRVFFPIFSYLLKTTRKALKLTFDLVHCNTYFPTYAGTAVAQLKDLPIISTFHDIYGLKGWIESQHSVAWGFLGNLATTVAVQLPHDRIIAVSPQCKQKLTALGVSETKITIIPNGVDLGLFDSTYVEKRPNQILYVGRLVNFKHADWLIYAFAKVLKELPDAKLKIVGGGPEQSGLQELVKKLGLQAHITFTGVTSSYEAVARYFKESTIFVLPSTVEGEAIVLKEAMAAHLPVIAMNVAGSGVLSLVQDGENGYLLEPGRPSLIAEKIIALLQDEAKRKKMGEVGRKIAEKYDWNTIANRTIQVYREAIENA